MPAYRDTQSRVVDSMRRARQLALLLGTGEEVDPQVLQALARVANRIAVDLAVIDRDLAVGMVA